MVNPIGDFFANFGGDGLEGVGFDSPSFDFPDSPSMPTVFPGVPVASPVGNVGFGIGRPFYGSLFSHAYAGISFSPWGGGDGGYAADLWRAGSIVYTMGNAITDTDPFRLMNGGGGWGGQMPNVWPFVPMQTMQPAQTQASQPSSTSPASQNAGQVPLPPGTVPQGQRGEQGGGETADPRQSIMDDYKKQVAEEKAKGEEEKKKAEDEKEKKKKEAEAAAAREKAHPSNFGPAPGAGAGATNLYGDVVPAGETSGGDEGKKKVSDIKSEPPTESNEKPRIELSPAEENFQTVAKNQFGEGRVWYLKDLTQGSSPIRLIFEQPDGTLFELLPSDSPTSQAPFKKGDSLPFKIPKE